MDMSLMNTLDSSEAGSWMPVLDLDWETPIGCGILVLGPDSKNAMAIMDEEEKFNQRRLAESFAGNKAAKDRADNELGADKAIRKAVRLTKDWRNIEWDGQPFPYSEDNAIKLYTKVPHIRAQVLGYWRDRAHFTRPEYANWRKQFGDDSSSITHEKVE